MDVDVVDLEDLFFFLVEVVGPDEHLFHQVGIRTAVEVGQRAGLEVAVRGVYGATQGPRLETAAEVDRLEQDGCDIVGMTGMPEASLARELGLCYAAIAVVANAAAGRGPGVLSMEEIELNLKEGMRSVRSLLEQAIPLA